MAQILNLGGINKKLRKLRDSNRNVTITEVKSSNAKNTSFLILYKGRKYYLHFYLQASDRFDPYNYNHIKVKNWELVEGSTSKRLLSGTDKFNLTDLRKVFK